MPNIGSQTLHTGFYQDKNSMITDIVRQRVQLQQINHSSSCYDYRLVVLTCTVHYPQFNY